MTIYNEESRKQYPDKPRDQKRQGGVIENWSVISFGNDEKKVVVGQIFTDVYREGSDIRTSLIYSINDDESEVETLNTVYQLGKKAPAA